MKDAAILFLLIVAVGLFVIMWRQHPAQQVAVDLPQPAIPSAVCVPPTSHYLFKQRRIA